MNLTPEARVTLARYADGPRRLEQAVAGLTDAQLDAPPAVGGWAIRQIVHHLADGDDIWKTGIKAALGDAGGVYAFDWYWALPQAAWAERWAADRRPLGVSLALFAAVRRHVTELLEHVPGAWERTISVRNRDGSVETVSAGFLVGMLADHLDHHLARIQGIRLQDPGA